MGASSSLLPLSRPPLDTFSFPQAFRQAALNEVERLEDIANPSLSRNSHHGPTHPLYKPPPPGSTDATAHADSHTGNMPASPVSPLIARYKVVDTD
jgi:hypothetical protein